MRRTAGCAALAAASVAALLAGCSPASAPGPVSISRYAAATGSAPAGRGGSRAASGMTRLAASSGTPDNLPADCIPSAAGPPTNPDELGVVILVSGGTLTAGPASVANISAEICGIASVEPVPPSEQGQHCPGTTTPIVANVSVNVPPDGQKFGPLQASLNVVPGLSPSVPFSVPPGHVTSTFDNCGSSLDGLQINATAAVSGSAGLFGVACTISVAPVVSATINGPFNALRGTLTAKNFLIPAAAPSFTCPPGVVKNLDQIVGLPIVPPPPTSKTTVDSLSLPFTGYFYYMPS